MKTLLIVIWTTLSPSGGYGHEILVFKTATPEDCQVFAMQIHSDGSQAYCRHVNKEMAEEGEE